MNTNNPLFCALTHALADRSDRPLLYDEAALLSAGLKLERPDRYHVEIASMARVMGVALRGNISHSDLAEYLLYNLAGAADPRGDARARRKHQAMIGTFFGNLPIDAKRAALQWKHPMDGVLRHIRIE